ncbi:hypothetical protein EPA93_10595 [Ktedonosporobacter rubrisoli]|uniref:Tetratricopeptide repeat protein n=1 Tax=Ktedonosporobacter rubrisoli TaxID=2509675 RepID=A0A4P6JMH8_KTERU|nr:hypothetical protein [Ktedonosporobacter rubrisoli]QBD76434.1 hypothetical protein EPA93_10595 [Ktedonosporobacter rubrisoli]
MSFDLTTKGLFVWPALKREHVLADLLKRYRDQLHKEKRLPEHKLLEQAREILHQLLAQLPLDEEVAHLGVSLCHYLKERELPILFLSRYLQQPLSTQEEAWARWHIVDHLALSKRCIETITTQKDLLYWAQLHFPARDMLWVMNDATQALCWIQKEQGEQWLQIFSDLFERAEATAKNRHDRFCYLRTAGIVCEQLKRVDETFVLTERIRQLAQEDPNWEFYLETFTEAFHLEIRAHHQLQHIDEVRRLGSLVSGLLEKTSATFTSETAMPENFWVRYHNLGAQLYFARQYDLAIPLFRRTLELSGGTAHTYLWLAASLWTQTKDRDQVLPLLSAATHLYAGGKSWTQYREQPEFEDVRDDQEFLQAVATRTSAV